MSIRNDLEKLLELIDEVNAKSKDIEDLKDSKDHFIRVLKSLGVTEIYRQRSLGIMDPLEDCELHRLAHEYTTSVIEKELDAYKENFRQSFLGTKG